MPAQEQPRLLSLRLKNLLSFGSAGQTLEMRPLTVLIGPNGSGKTNLIEAISVLRSLPRGGLAEVIRLGGGIRNWLWKGADGESAELESTWRLGGRAANLTHRIEIAANGAYPMVSRESITAGQPHGGAGSGARETSSPCKTVYAYDRALAQATARVCTPTPVNGKSERELRVEQHASVLAQYRDPTNYPEMGEIARAYESIRIYRRWVFGPDAVVRNSETSILPADSSGTQMVTLVEEHGWNLAMVIENLVSIPEVKTKLMDSLRELYEGISDLRVDPVSESIVLLQLIEEGNRAIPFKRLSDGTLRYLSLLAILLHPEPPPLVCIEEPELGLHPDLIGTVGRLLIEASVRMQLIVTTHSTALISALDEVPESIVVCDRALDGTRLRRLQADRMHDWLEKYSLGDLWEMGELGGHRW